MLLTWPHRPCSLMPLLLPLLLPPLLLPLLAEAGTKEAE
jgi:hypothetical protein